jgi:hypothetical protein
MLTEVAPTRYIVKVNGVAVCTPQPTYQLAEAQILSLPEASRQYAQVIPVTVDNKELLLG